MGAQSTDAENDRAPLKVADRSAPVKRASLGGIQDNRQDTDLNTSALTGDSLVQKFGGSSK